MSTANYYYSTQKVHVPTEVFQGSLQTDVAIVGGGLTGASAALHLAEQGYGVALLEARDIAWGASGRNGGQILPGLAIPQHRLRQLVGEQDARRIWDFSLEAVALLKARVERHCIPCDLRWGYLHAAIKPRQVNELGEWQSELAQVGHVTQLLQGEALRAELNSPGYLAGLFDPTGGHLHPLNYTLGLANAAQDAGARLFSGSPVTRVRTGDPLLIETPQGHLRARYLLLCGNAYLGDLMPPIRSYVMPVGTYILASQPLPEALARQIIRHDYAVSDLNFVLDYFRLSSDHRLLFGGRVSYSTVPPPRLGDTLLARLRRVFPQLYEARADFVWGGNVGITRNRAPHFGRLAPNIYFAHGYSGHGVALTGMAGKLLAEVVAGQAERFDVFARIPHRPFPGGRALRLAALLLGTTYYRLRDLL